MTKFIFVTGGVLSSLGKGITSASIATILKQSGFKVSMLKIDPYLNVCLLYTSDAADERSSVDLGGRRIIKKKNKEEYVGEGRDEYKQEEQRHGEVGTVAIGSK